MGRKPAGERRSFVGESFEDKDGPATLEQALLAATEAAVHDAKFIRPLDPDDPTSGPLWFDLTGVQVELANQHVKTMRVTVTER